MPVVAVNVVKVVLVLCLYGFLFYVARAMRSQVGQRADATPAAGAVRRRAGSEDAAPPAPIRASLRVGPDGETRILDVGGRIVVGRGTSADLTVDDEYASDQHAVFGFDGQTVWVEDLESTNGTRIGDTMITERTTVPSGGEVLVGRTRIVVL
jgi:hypothetical protein